MKTLLETEHEDTIGDKTRRCGWRQMTTWWRQNMKTRVETDHEDTGGDRR